MLSIHLTNPFVGVFLHVSYYDWVSLLPSDGVFLHVLWVSLLPFVGVFLHDWVSLLAEIFFCRAVDSSVSWDISHCVSRTSNFWYDALHQEGKHSNNIHLSHHYCSYDEIGNPLLAFEVA